MPASEQAIVLGTVLLDGSISTVLLCSKYSGVARLSLRGVPAGKEWANPEMSGATLTEVGAGAGKLGEGLRGNEGRDVAEKVA